MIITLTTDFGLSDPFVGIMKGVILGIAPGAQLVDLGHDIPSYDIVEAVFSIESAYRYFPDGTVHLVVVDPGVGSARRPLAAAFQGHFFVGPDNGVLSAVLENDVYHIQNEALFRKPVSRTFHGRDIFAPVAAHLAQGMPLQSVGQPVDDFIRRPLPRLQRLDSKLVGAVLRIDKFGNVITNVRRADVGPEFTIRLAGKQINRLCSNFTEAGSGELFAIEGSAGYIEIALNQGSAAERLHIQRGDEIEVETRTANH